VKAHESDRALVQRLLPSRNDDPRDRAAAWSEWYVQIGEASVLAFVRAKNDTPEPDVDILQEAMVTAYIEVERGRYEPRVGIPFAAYVKGIAHNKIREARRRSWRYVFIEDVPTSLAESFLLDKSDTRPERIVERREERAFLHDGMSRLTPCRRQVLEGYLQGRSTTEIAETLGISEDAVRQHKSRGLRSLRQMDVLA
jgi:RNA polymerase sigma factor (sigma-70 family)